MTMELAQAINAARIKIVKFWDAIELIIRLKLRANLITPEHFFAMLTIS